MSAPLTCPQCGAVGSPLIATRVGPGQHVAVCSSCGMALVLDAGTVRRAVAADLATLTPEELTELQHHRGTKRRLRARP